MIIPQPFSKVRLQLGQTRIDLLANRDPIELLEPRALQALDDPIRLRTLHLGARMIAILHR